MSNEEIQIDYSYNESPSEYNVNQRLNKINNEAIQKKVKTSGDKRDKFCSFRPAINPYRYTHCLTFIKICRDKNSNSIEERLIMAGRKYEEKRKQKQYEEQVRKEEEETKIISVSKSVCLQRNCDENGIKTPVEDRLQKYLQKYHNKVQDLRQEQEFEELKTLRNPQINQISEQIVASIEVWYCD
jgi:hypothetical protein